MTAGQNADIHGAAVMFFHSHRHVMLVNEQFAIRGWNLIGRDEFMFRQ